MAGAYPSPWRRESRRQKKRFDSFGPTFADWTPELLTRENDFRDLLVRYAKLRGWMTYFTWSSIHSPEGYPDITLCKNGVLIFAELKSEKGKLSDFQERWGEELEKVNGVGYHVWRPSDWPAIKQLLDS